MKRDLYLAFLKEQYDAARHHQTMRIATTAFLLGASGAILSKAMDSTTGWQSLAIIGAILIALGATSAILNGRFHDANRLHAEIASWVRRILADLPADEGNCPDPNIIRRAVVGHLHKNEKERDAAIHAELVKSFRGLTGKQEPSKTSSKIEFSLNGPLKLVPLLVILGGVASIAGAILRWHASVH